MTAIFANALQPKEFPQASPASVWTINHGLGRPPVGLQVFDSAGTQVFGAVTNPTDEQTVITFISAFGGKAEYL